MDLYKFKKRIILELVSPNKFFLINFSIFLIHSILGFFKRSKRNNGSPILIWDARRESITYDFTCYILNAVNENLQIWKNEETWNNSTHSAEISV